MSNFKSMPYADETGDWVLVVRRDPKKLKKQTRLMTHMVTRSFLTRKHALAFAEMQGYKHFDTVFVSGD